MTRKRQAPSAVVRISCDYCDAPAIKMSSLGYSSTRLFGCKSHMGNASSRCPKGHSRPRFTELSFDDCAAILKQQAATLRKSAPTGQQGGG